MAAIFSLILSFYCLLLVVILIGWIIIRRQSINFANTSAPGISVVIAVRNEINNIQNLVHNLSSISYPRDKFEVIIVNDHSTDGTFLRLKELVAGVSLFRLIDLPLETEGKKSALRIGIDHANFDIIATTDADCQFSKNWLKCISLNFEKPEVKMVIGAVKLVANESFFSRLQVTEFISLAGSTAAAIGLGHPIMCNGANLAFRKSTFNEVGGYDDNLKIASGDDEFLMRKIYKRYPSGIRFLNFYEGVVSTTVQRTFRDFLYQRIRWAGKWRHNSDILTQFLAVFIFLSQIAFLGLIIRNIYIPDLSLGWILSKLFLEAIFFLWVGRFLERKFDILSFLALQILHPVYVIGVGALSLVSSYRWKNRNYK
jgi:poly-beta-1,6-N-acetyl-D-glucosamine synthase